MRNWLLLLFLVTATLSLSGCKNTEPSSLDQVKSRRNYKVMNAIMTDSELESYYRVNDKKDTTRQDFDDIYSILKDDLPNLDSEKSRSRAFVLLPILGRYNPRSGDPPLSPEVKSAMEKVATFKGDGYPLLVSAANNVLSKNPS